MRHIPTICLSLIALSLIILFAPTSHLIDLVKFDLNKPLTLSDIVSLLSFALSAFALVVGVRSVRIATRQLEDAQRGSEAQAKILLDQQRALNESTSALQAVNGLFIEQQETLKETLIVINKQFGVISEQWQETQRRLSRSPLFNISWQFGYYVTEVKFGQPKGEPDSFIVSIGSGGYLSQTSDWFTDGDSENNTYFISDSNTFPLSKPSLNNAYFDLNVRIRNIGTANADGVQVRIYPLAYFDIVGKSFLATGAMLGPKGLPIYDPAIIDKKQLPIFENSKEEIYIPLKIEYRNFNLGKDIAVKIEVYSLNSPVKGVTIPFVIMPKNSSQIED